MVIVDAVAMFVLHFMGPPQRKSANLLSGVVVVEDMDVCIKTGTNETDDPVSGA